PLKQCRHVNRDGNKHLRVFESKTQCAIATHGDSTDGPPRTIFDKTKTLLHLRHKFTNEEVFIQYVAIARVDVERALGFGRDDHKLAQAFLVPGVFNHTGCAAGSQEALVSAQPMQKIERRKMLARLGVITRRQHGTEANASRDILAPHGAALHARFRKTTYRAEQ